MQIYTDGSYRIRTKLGAFAALIIDHTGKKTILSGTKPNVTNNQMEMYALIAALHYIKEHKLDRDNEISIFSDSQYVVEGLKSWWPKWKANNFKTSSGTTVKNIKLWKMLVKLSKEVKCTLSWVKGHAGNQYNNEVDKIVSELTSVPHEQDL